MAEIISRPYDKNGEDTYERVFICPKCDPDASKLEACKGKTHCLFQIKDGGKEK